MKCNWKTKDKNTDQTDEKGISGKWIKRDDMKARERLYIRVTEVEVGEEPECGRCEEQLLL